MSSKPSPAAAIAQRRSVRRYHPAAVAPEAIERMLAAATQAPSAHNRQPWRFVVLDTTDGKHKLATAMGERLRQDRTADQDDVQAIEVDVARSYARITTAPAVIVVCVDMSDMDSYPDDKRRNAEYLMAVQSTAMATQNLLLAAEQDGLGACIMCAPLFCPDTVLEALDLPRAWAPQLLVTVGSPAAPGKIRPRLPLDDVVTWPSRKP